MRLSPYAPSDLETHPAGSQLLLHNFYLKIERDRELELNWTLSALNLPALRTLQNLTIHHSSIKNFLKLANWSAVAQSAQLLTSLDVAADASSCIQVLKVAQTIPALKNFAVNDVSNYAGGTSATISFLSFSHPAIESLSIVSSRHFGIKKLDVPCLTSFSLTLWENGAVVDVGHVLANFPNLTSLCLRVVQPQSIRLVHEGLRELYLSGRSRSDTTHLPQIHLPSLRSFELLGLENLRSFGNEELFVNPNCDYNLKLDVAKQEALKTWILERLPNLGTKTDWRESKLITLSSRAK